MKNHVHLLITPISAISISRVLQHIGSLYVCYINKIYKRSGTLWEKGYEALCFKQIINWKIYKTGIFMKKLCSLFLTFFIFSGSSAFAYDCLGKVNQLVVGPNGTVTAGLGNMGWVYLCNVNSIYNGVAPDACKSIFSTLLAAKLADKNVRMWFSDTSNDCTNVSHPAWSDLKNWYFGPSIE